MGQCHHILWRGCALQKNQRAFSGHTLGRQLQHFEANRGQVYHLGVRRARLLDLHEGAASSGPIIAQLHAAVWLACW